MQPANNETTFLDRATILFGPFLNEYSKIPFSDKNIALTDQTSQNERYVYYGKETLNAASKLALVGTALAVTGAFIQAVYEQTLILAIGTTLTAGLWKLSKNPDLIGAAVKQVTTFVNANQKATFPTLDIKKTS